MGFAALRAVLVFRAPVIRSWPLLSEQLSYQLVGGCHVPHIGFFQLFALRQNVFKSPIPLCVRALRSHTDKIVPCPPSVVPAAAMLQQTGLLFKCIVPPLASASLSGASLELQHRWASNAAAGTKASKQPAPAPAATPDASPVDKPAR